jgi:hypothetical protein
MLSLAAGCLLPLIAHAEDAPKEGTANFTNAWVAISSNTMQQGASSFNTYELNGLTHNDSGPMFNLFGLRCIGLWDGRGGGEYSDHGTCTFTDKDGNNVFMPYSGSNGRGTYKVAGGTGKFTGITGSGEYVVNSPGQIKSDDKRNRGFISNTVSWKIP